MEISPFVISQILVGLALIADLSSFQFKDRRVVLIILIIAASLISAHFFVLEVYAAGALVFVSTFRFIVAYFTTDKRVLALMLLLSCSVFVFTFEGHISILALAASLFLTWGAFQAEDRKLRLYMMSGTSLWIIHNILIFTPMGILGESVFLFSNLLGYYRFYIKK